MPADDERPLTFAPVVTNRPAPQVVSGFQVAPVAGVIAYDAFWSAASVTVDVEFVRISHRLPGAANPEWTGVVPRPQLLTGSARVTEGLLPAQNFEVQIQYLPKSGRATVASGWLTVAIADVRIGPDDLTDELNDRLETIQDFLDTELPALQEELDGILAQIADLGAAPEYDPAVTYAVDQLVKYNGGLYRATAATAGNLPTNTAFWFKIGDYASLGEAVAALSGRITNAESAITFTNKGIASSTRDTRLLANALMNNALLNGEEADALVEGNTDNYAALAFVSEQVRTEVSRLDGTTTALAEQVSVVQAQVQNDFAQAIASISTQVQAIGGVVTAQAETVDQLRVVVGDSGAEVLVKGQVTSGPNGPGSRYAIRLQATDDGEIVAQGLFFIDLAGSDSTIGFQASKTVFYNSDGDSIALFNDDFEFRSANGKVVIDMITGDFSFG